MKTGRLLLTQNELRILTLMARGYAPKEISARVNKSRKAVSSALRRVLRRAGVDNYLQLGMLLERCQALPADERNRIEDRREERLSAPGA